MINQPIEMVVQTDIAGNMKLIRFRIKDQEDVWQVIKIEKFKMREPNGYTKDKRVFDCLVIVNGIKRVAEIYYNINTMKWVLYNLK